jgi:hypothetical protein
MGAGIGQGTGSCSGGRGNGRMNRGTSRGAAARGLCGWFEASELAGHSPRENEVKLLKAEADALAKRQEDVNRRLS